MTSRFQNDENNTDNQNTLNIPIPKNPPDYRRRNPNRKPSQPRNPQSRPVQNRPSQPRQSQSRPVQNYQSPPRQPQPRPVQNYQPPPRQSQSRPVQNYQSPRPRQKSRPRHKSFFGILQYVLVYLADDKKQRRQTGNRYTYTNRRSDYEKLRKKRTGDRHGRTYCRGAGAFRFNDSAVIQ